MNEKLGEIQRKLDLVRVVGVLLYTHLVHVITGVPTSRYECVHHKRVGVALETTVETLYEKYIILRSANTKYHLFFFFFYQIKKGDLP